MESMSWTLLAKPGAQNWTDSHPQGKERYDESTITYDSADTYYDGFNPNQWTDIPKPVGSTRIVAGMITGLIMPVTYSREYSVDPWIRVSKPQ